MFNTGNPDDDARLEALSDGDGLTRPYRWSHFLQFSDQTLADQAAERLAEDYDTRVLENPNGPGWVLQAVRDEVVLTPEAVTEARADLSGLAQAFAGRYDGWLAWV